MSASVGLAIVWSLRRRPIVTGLAMVLLWFPIDLAIVVGNVDAFIVLALIVIWEIQDRGHQASAEILLGFIASLKLTPVAIVFWAFATGKIRMATVAILTMVALVPVTMGLTEPDMFLQFARVTLFNFAGSPGLFSLAAIGGAIGIAPDVSVWLPRVGLVLGLLAILLLRRRSALAWAVAILTMIFGSPLTAFHTPALLLAAPAALLVGRGRASAGSRSSSDRSSQREEGEPRVRDEGAEAQPSGPSGPGTCSSARDSACGTTHAAAPIRRRPSGSPHLRQIGTR